jgi:hypothetical protein
VGGGLVVSGVFWLNGCRRLWLRGSRRSCGLWFLCLVLLWWIIL